MPDKICLLDINDKCPIEAREGCENCDSYITLNEYGEQIRNYAKSLKYGNRFKLGFVMEDYLNTLISSWLCICLLGSIVFYCINNNANYFYFMIFISFVYLFFIRNAITNKKEN